jgi:hypothetical protein
MNFTTEQKKLIYNAVRQYQSNRVTLNSSQYHLCDEILNGLFDEVKMNYVEPAYEVQPVPPTRPANGFGFNV